MGNEWQMRTVPLRSSHRDRVDVRKFRLVVEAGESSGASFVSNGDRVVIGTHDGADLKLSDRSVSRFHCELVLSAEAVVLTDLRSRNGTSVDGVPVTVAP